MRHQHENFMNSRSFLFLFYCMWKGEVFTAIKKEDPPNCVIKIVQITGEIFSRKILWIRPTINSECLVFKIN